MLLDGERNTLLQALPVFPEGVTDLGTVRAPDTTMQIREDDHKYIFQLIRALMRPTVATSVGLEN